jgi:endonuclease G
MGSLARPESWSYNPNLSTNVQVNLCNRSYTNSDTYVRGHLIPNASRNGIKEMQLQTFYVTNSVPQMHTNFNNGIWQSLEAALQSEAKSETVYIVTGVAFAKQGESKTVKYTTAKDDTKRVPVPNYFYKVALKVTTNSSGVVTSASTVGFWFEHRTYSDSYANYAVTVDQIEEWTGFDFFPNLPDSIEVTAESNSSWATFNDF